MKIEAMGKSYLQELTGQESGIVLYPNEAMVINWSSIDGLPRYLGPIGPISLRNLEEEAPEIEGYTWRKLYRGTKEAAKRACRAYADANDDHRRLYAIGRNPRVYVLNPGDDEVIIIAPRGWC